MVASSADFERDFPNLKSAYVLERPVLVKLESKMIAFIKTPCKIETSFVAQNPSLKQTFANPAIIQIEGNGGTLLWQDLSFIHNAHNPAFTSGILVRDAESVCIYNFNVYQSPLHGVEIRDCKKFQVTNCTFSENCFSGLAIVNCENGTICNNDVSYNGLEEPINGYGITLTGYKLNRNIKILGNRCIKNKRKGIDVHNGCTLNIGNNYVENIGDSGIAAVSQSSTKLVKDVRIYNNTVVTYSESPTSGINVGSYMDGKDCPIEVGNVEVTNNTIYNPKILRRMNAKGILVYMPQEKGAVIDRLDISDNNIILNGNGPNYGICVAVSPLTIPKAKIHANNIQMLGECVAGILASSVKDLDMQANLVSVESGYWGICVGKNPREISGFSTNVIEGKFIYGRCDLPNYSQ